ncbi:MAG: type I-E CRISPR-associated protein Cas7/Cse4/CasC [Desulfovibrio sp.]|nr:type I-E CRISPR-associated protein Cas7/Cse4/CasC [Desulfovibrio sp.]
MNNNSLTGYVIEFHILQSFPVSCLNRDDVGAPKTAIVGGVPRARVSSQCWKRQVRLALHDLGVPLGIRTKRLSYLLCEACKKKGASTEDAEKCGKSIADVLAEDTLLFISEDEILTLAEYAAQKEFKLPVNKKPKKKVDSEENSETTDTDGSLSKEVKKDIKSCLCRGKKGAVNVLDIALFGRMVAQAPEVNVHAASAFAHAISTHHAVNEVEFFTALDDRPEKPGSAHMGTLEYNSATYYRYVSLDLGQLLYNIGEDDVPYAVESFTKALFIAVPSARQTTQSASCPWDYARVLVRKGQRMQLSFEKPVRAAGNGFLAPSIEALNEGLKRCEDLGGSLYGKIVDCTFGCDATFSIDDLCEKLVKTVHTLEGKA